MHELKYYILENRNKNNIQTCKKNINKTNLKMFYDFKN